MQRLMALSWPWISNKMIDALTTRQRQRCAVIVILMLMALGSIAAARAATKEANWPEPLQQYGWDTKELKNKVQHGDVTTFELGTPNYQILNPEDEPEFITEDQPHYREMLRRLTSSSNGTDTIDMAMPGVVSSVSASAAAGEDLPRRPKWEKLRKRSSNPDAPKHIEQQQHAELEMEAAPLDKRSIQPKVQIYAGAKPFQTRIANLS
ncbi:uncharacterized protein LOC117564993 [Drosophila albomicans]|uniref:Uncharacterized protein LOC117564993 n=1 Tax=Drosophila albomicans TaxID=7291 RepID=A0A6P8W8M5_DROAB|nr:uncharacterized protein LOC117564993 [Drosophila albomicans]